MEKLVIVGGGVAGLSCLNALLDRQVSPLLLEASTVGSPKMCGEFLAPNVITRLNQWGIGPLQSIRQAHFFGSQRKLTLAFPRKAGAYSRHHAEMELAARARNHGGRIREGVSIQAITPATQNTPFTLQLTDGEMIQAQDVFFATGKWSQTKIQTQSPAWMGFKTHIKQVLQPDTLLMYTMNGGYLGVVPISSQVSNITCLVKREVIDKAGSCTDFFTRFTEEDRRFKQSGISCPVQALDWREGDAPAFGLKTVPNWPHAYWIGDALLSIHPAIGYGFAHAVSSACWAVDHYLHQDPVGYHQAIQRRVRPKRILATCMHHLLQKPRLCNALSPVLGANPWMGHQLLKTLDY